MTDSFAGRSTVTAPPQWAEGLAAGIHAVGSRDVLYVPDNPLSHIVRVLESRHLDIRLVVATREEEAVGIAAGLYLGKHRPTVMMQSSGIGNALNALGSLLIAYQIPILLVVSMRGDPGEWNWAQVPLGRAIRPVLDALGMQYTVIDRAEEAEERVRLAGSLAFGARFPAACLLPLALTSPVEPPRTLA